MGWKSKLYHYRKPDFLDTSDQRAYNQRFIVRQPKRLWVPVMDKKRLDNYKKKLQTKREELVHNIARVEAEGRAADEDTTVDLADKAANSYTKEFLFGQTNAERAFLHLIEEALKRIGSGKFGECANCEEEINQKRLDAVPWAKYCIDCQEKQEHGQL
jgi:RNA polymerase-binding transcription factor